MRLIIHNPHTDVYFGTSLLNFITGSLSFKRYKYFFDYLVKKNKNFAIYVDGYGSSFPRYISKYFPKKMEIYLWLLINRYNPFKFDLIYKIEDIKKDDIFFSFTYFNLDGQNPVMEQLKNVKFIKVFHIDHFNMRTSEIAKNAKRLGVDFFVAENNLSKNSTFFKKYFSFYKDDVYQLPFVFKSRFEIRKNFNERLNKALATGTVIDIKQLGDGELVFKDFINFYHTYYIQPLRFEIYKNKNKLKKILDSHIGYLWDKKRKEVAGKPNILKIVYSKLYNAFVLAKRDYYKLDIVDEYNKYKMFIVPEEANDVPGIGFVEGMACGVAYIGKKDPMYADLGMKSGVHYIGHNGTLKDIVKKINFYQKNPEKLEKIAHNGYLFVTKNLNQDIVSEKFWDELMRVSKKVKKRE